MVEDAVERYERYVRITKISTLISTIIAVSLNIWASLTLFTDLLGINLGYWVNKIIKYGWQLPPDWVIRYRPYLDALEWILLVTIIIDTTYVTKLMNVDKREPPLWYIKIMSVLELYCAMWLYFAYKIPVFGVMVFASIFTIAYSFIKKDEVETEEEEEPTTDIWKESMSVSDFWS